MKLLKYGLEFIKIVIFILAFCVIFVQLTYLYRGDIGNVRRNMCGFYAEEEDSLDVVILGTSSTFSSYMPFEAWNEYGYTSYNMCTNVLFVETIKYYVRELQKTQHPKVLVIDISPFIFEHRADMFREQPSILRYNTDGMSVSLNRFELVHEIIPKGERTEFYFDLLFYHNNEPDVSFMYNKKFNQRKGYANLPIQVTFDESQYIDPVIVAEPEECVKQELLELLEELKTYDGEILFIEQPAFYTEETSYQAGCALYVQNTVQSYGYDFLNMAEHRQEMGIDPRVDYSLDYLHFNANSARKITHFLGNYLVTNYELPDHRGDLEYDRQWADEYQIWFILLSEHISETDAQAEQILTVETN